MEGPRPGGSAGRATKRGRSLPGCLKRHPPVGIIAPFRWFLLREMPAPLRHRARNLEKREGWRLRLAAGPNLGEMTSVPDHGLSLWPRISAHSFRASPLSNRPWNTTNPLVHPGPIPQSLDTSRMPPLGLARPLAPDLSGDRGATTRFGWAGALWLREWSASEGA